MYTETKGHWYELGRTENVKNCLNPDFVKTFETDYYFEEVQKLRFELFDIDNTTPQLDDDDYLGGIECTLGQVVSGSPFSRPLLLRNRKNAGKGTITLHTEEQTQLNELLLMTFRAQKLDKKVIAEETAKLNDVLMLSFMAKKLEKKDLLGKSDPYLEFSRQRADDTWTVVHRTEVIKNNLNPQWRPFQLKVQKLCAGNYEAPIKVDCYDYDSSGSHGFIGSFGTSAMEMMSAGQKQLQWPCINPKKKAKKKSYQNSGVVFLTSCKVTKEHSFLDFIFGGLQLNFTVGIDFTASNGAPTQSTSLHYMNPYQPNEYMRAIQSVGAVIQDYDSDQLFPALGFGAKVPPDMSVSHEFALNFNPQNPFCAGVEGIMAAYQNCVSAVQLYGPTNFAPIINHVSQFASATQRDRAPKDYFILLIITDGVISDMDNTISAIVRCSTLPMSIIIVGVGAADFTAMNILDTDDRLLKDHLSHKAKRDIVQFVPFRDFYQAPPPELARVVLYEIPGQVTGYYKMLGIEPSAPRNLQQVPPGGQAGLPPRQQPSAPPVQPGAPPAYPPPTYQ